MKYGLHSKLFHPFLDPLFSQTKDFKNVFRWKQKKKSWNGKIFEEWRVVKSPKGEWFWVTRECLDAVRSNYYICTLAHKCKNSGLHIIRWWSFCIIIVTSMRKIDVNANVHSCINLLYILLLQLLRKIPLFSTFNKFPVNFKSLSKPINAFFLW